MPGRQCLILLNRAGAMTSTSEALAALPPFQVMSRVDLKVAAGGFKDSWKLGQGLRCVAPAARHPPSNVLRCPLPILYSGSRGVSRRLDCERVLPARPSRARETALGRAAGGSRRATVEKPRLYHPPRARSSLTTHGSFIRSSKTHVRFFFVIVVFRQSSFVTSPGGARTRARSRPYPWR